MFKIDPLKGFWTITHLTCGAKFQITGQKVLDTKQQIKCSNCSIPIGTELLKHGVDGFDTALRDIERSSQTLNEPYKKVWQIDPPIKIIEEDETP